MQQLEQELECARLEYARQVLWEDDYSSEGAGNDGYEGSLEGFSVRSDGGFEATGPAEAEGDGDMWCGATVTGAAPAGTAGAANIPGDADDVGGLGGGQQRLWCGCGARVRAVLDRCRWLNSVQDMYHRW